MNGGARDGEHPVRGEGTNVHAGGKSGAQAGIVAIQADGHKEIFLPARFSAEALRHGADGFHNPIEAEIRKGRRGNAGGESGLDEGEIGFRHIAGHHEIGHVGDAHEGLVLVDGIAHANGSIFAVDVERIVGHHTVGGGANDALGQLAACVVELVLQGVEL